MSNTYQHIAIVIASAPQPAIADCHLSAIAIAIVPQLQWQRTLPLPLNQHSKTLMQPKKHRIHRKTIMHSYIGLQTWPQWHHCKMHSFQGQMMLHSPRVVHSLKTLSSLQMTHIPKMMHSLKVMHSLKTLSIFQVLHSPKMMHSLKVMHSLNMLSSPRVLHSLNLMHSLQVLHSPKVMQRDRIERPGYRVLLAHPLLCEAWTPPTT